ncbi:MAG: beta-L-arabinofuranosidase domain-containing protein [Terriglobia bacterium]|jgi:DUF1680 family protein
MGRIRIAVVFGFAVIRFLGGISLLLGACLAFGIAALAQTGNEPWKVQGIINTSASPKAKLHSVPIRAVTMGEGFWSERMRTNAEKSIPTLLGLLEEHGVVDNFRRLSGRVNAGRRGPRYTDSDLYKWMEAVAFVLQSGDRPQLRETLDKLIDDVLAAQEPSGYLNTYYVGDRAKLRFSEMYRSHELYCLGHLLQAAIAYYRATGNRKLLDGGIKYADYVLQTLGPEKKPALTGHPEFEMALVELYRTTGDKRYLDFVNYLFTGEKLRLQLTDDQVTYLFSGIPFTSRMELEGHAVRALYACSGATDYYLETGDAQYHETLGRLWKDLVERKMYITGGVGSYAEGEAVGVAYDLPNQRAYAESCAAIANMMWNWRMLAASAGAPYADVIEKALYNGINSGMSLSGTLYCYRNPLESRGEEGIRQPWYDTTCCPPNLERTFASIPGYLYSTDSSGVYVHLYHSSTLDWHLENGTGLKLVQQTKYPWDGDITLKVSPAKTATFTLYLRIPGWASKATVTLDGKPAPGKPKPGDYFAIRREWKAASTVRLQLDMAPHLVAANPLVREDYGRVAVQRGPLMYCLEQVDQEDQASVFDVVLPAGPDPSQGFASEFRPDILGGIVMLKHKGMATPKPLSEEPLYQTIERTPRGEQKEVNLTFIPYYAWANRLPGAMEVWIPYLETRSALPVQKAR